MARSLVSVAAVGITVSVISLMMASIISPEGSPWSRYSRGYSGGWWGDSARSWRDYTPFTESGEIITREFEWYGGDGVEIYIPAVVYFERGTEWRVIVTGPESSVERLRIEAGRIFFDGSLRGSHGSSLEVQLKGPALSNIALNGSGKLVLENVSQAELELDILGSGSVQGRGTVERLALRLLGSGNAMLAELSTEDMDVEILGSGNADVSPTGNAEVTIFGSGDVRLHAYPRHLATKIFGSGRVIQWDRGQDASPDQPDDARVNVTPGRLPIATWISH
ncbi:MAG: DUF2807 domain-containing protein [Gammaproteobacteria bacterium]|nr:DUF2807 domain-containing protein [Gammaproteobacteria bacterium]